MNKQLVYGVLSVSLGSIAMAGFFLHVLLSDLGNFYDYIVTWGLAMTAMMGVLAGSLPSLSDEKRPAKRFKKLPLVGIFVSVGAFLLLAVLILYFQIFVLEFGAE